jgi:hypothetical protein
MNEKHICCDCKKETRCLLDWEKKLYCTKCRGYDIITITQKQEDALCAWFESRQFVLPMPGKESSNGH